MITIFAPDGIGEVTEETDLAETIVAAVAASDQGPLADGDIVVVTSKIISKQEGRRLPAESKAAAIKAETVRTVARRGQTAIVNSRLGLTMAAAGVDNSNVDTQHILLLPLDPDASAERLRLMIAARHGIAVGVIISDTSGRVWRIGQTDLAIGAAGVRVLEPYAGRQDSYGNELHVTAVALADELASAADLAKSKLGQRPVAVIRGLAELVERSATSARELIRSVEEDLFSYGSREAVIIAVLTATGQAERFEEIAALTTTDEVVSAVITGAKLYAEQATALEAVLRAAVPAIPEPATPPTH